MLIPFHVLLPLAYSWPKFSSWFYFDRKNAANHISLLQFCLKKKTSSSISYPTDCVFNIRICFQLRTTGLKTALTEEGKWHCSMSTNTKQLQLWQELNVLRRCWTGRLRPFPHDRSHQTTSRWKQWRGRHSSGTFHRLAEGTGSWTCPSSCM